jgi:hypothetical protein
LTTSLEERACPGCGLKLPLREGAACHGYYHASPECWSIYAEVLGLEYNNPALFGAVHQLTVDTYASQHAGGLHPDKSVAIHLSGLHLVLEQGVRPFHVPPLLQRLAAAVEVWPHLEPPVDRGMLTVWDIALTGPGEEYLKRVQEWALQVWGAWSEYHATVKSLVSNHLALG